MTPRILFSIMLVSLTVLFGKVCSYQQTNPPSEISSLRDTKKSAPVRICFATGQDSLPDIFEVCGKVVEETVPPHCGGIAFAGTLRIVPLKKVAGYSPESVYVVVPCLGDAGGSFIGRTVKVVVTKLYADQQSCFFDVIQNQLESKGVPFYCMQSDRDSLNNVKCGL